MSNKFRFDVLNQNGYQEPYTGLFNDREQAVKWYLSHGKWLEEQGRKLIMVRCQSKSDQELEFR
jgi:hypothetical protein